MFNIDGDALKRFAEAYQFEPRGDNEAVATTTGGSPLAFRWEAAVFSPWIPMERVPDILRGTLDLLILTALSSGAKHGYGVARWLEEATNDALAVGEGTLYPALHRLEERGWIAAGWGPSENNRHAKFYSLTRSGRSRLRLEHENWRRYASAVFSALDAAASSRSE